MADALVSPAVGGTLWAVTGGLMAVSVRRLRECVRDNLVPLMGVLGAFVFTSQMINFTIPGTGSSGHLGGGLLLAILLGPHAAFLVLASVLTVQALFFMDGGLLALGCNIFNLGFYPAFVAFPLIYRPLAKGAFASPRAWVAAIVAAVVGLQLGAFSVVLETKASGITDLPFGTFLMLMQPIHLAIGVVEGLATAAVVAFVVRARPEALPEAAAGGGAAHGRRAALWGLIAAAAVVGGGLSWFASTRPDGLEWSVAKAAGKEEVGGVESGLHRRLAAVQERLAVLPDYGFRAGGEAAAEADEKEEPWPAVSAGTSISGLTGGLATLALVFLIVFLLRLRRTAR